MSLLLNKHDIPGGGGVISRVPALKKRKQLQGIKI